MADVSFLRIAHATAASPTHSLQGLRIIVIGGGPAGLTFARAATSHGAEIIVLEKASDPRGENPGYTDRSFNLTLNNVGRHVLGDENAWHGGIRLVGRAIHAHQNSSSVQYAVYGPTSNYDLISIPRPIFRQNMATLALDEGADIRFNSHVISVDPEKGEVTFVENDGILQKLSADLIIISDGFHSLGNELVVPETGKEHYFKPEPRSCVSALLYPADNHNLSLSHIHFWHTPETTSYAIGIPNSDGSVALLLASHFADLPSDTHPFANSRDAKLRLQREFPDLFALEPRLAERLPSQQKYHFSHKALTSYHAGDKVIVVGDAGCAMPPWAGFGANSAMYGAASLVHHLVKNQGNVVGAMKKYQTHMQTLSHMLLGYVEEQSEFFNGSVSKNPNARPDADLSRLIKLAYEKTA